MRNHSQAGSRSGGLSSGIILILLGIVILVIGKQNFDKDNAFKQNAIATTAVVTDVYEVDHSTDEDDETTYDLDVEYEAGGEKIKAKIYDYSSYMSVGEELTVYYDKDNYQHVKAEFTDIKFIGFFGIGIIVFGILFSVVRAFRTLRRL